MQCYTKYASALAEAERKQKSWYCDTPAVTQGVHGPLQSPFLDAPGTAETAETNHSNSWLQ